MKTKTKNKIKKWWKKTRKSIYKSICAIVATLLCVGCGTTKVAVNNPKDGTYTTITVTTNNPITTTTDPQTDINLKLWDKK